MLSFVNNRDAPQRPPLVQFLKNSRVTEPPVSGQRHLEILSTPYGIELCLY